MKNTYLVVLLCITSFCYSQSLINPPVLGTFTPDNINWSDTVFSTNINYYPRSFNWSGWGAKLDTALKINSYHSGFAVLENTNIPVHVPMVIQLTGVLTHSWRSPSVFNTESMWFHPEITVDSSEKFKPLAKDSQSAVFDWQIKDHGAGGTGIDATRYKLLANSVSNGRDTVLWNAALIFLR